MEERPSVWFAFKAFGLLLKHLSQADVLLDNNNGGCH